MVTPISSFSSALKQSKPTELFAQKHDPNALWDSSSAVFDVLRKTTHFPEAPLVIEQAWFHLVPAIAELSHHHHHNALNVSIAQSVFMAGKPLVKRRGERINQKQVLFYKSWFYDLLILLGTLPVDASEISETLNERSLARVGQSINAKNINQAADALSSPSRGEAMMCLDLLCSKAWYARHHGGSSEQDIRLMLLYAIQYLYWECGIPSQISEMYGQDSDDLNNPLFRDVRALNYRQLYELYGQGRLRHVFLTCDEGVEALETRRTQNQARFNLEAKRDARSNMTYEQCAAMIIERYKKEQSVEDMEPQDNEEGGE